MAEEPSTEETVFMTMSLPEGRDYVWMADCNTVVLSDRLDCDGKILAVQELQRQWARAHLSVVRTA